MATVRKIGVGITGGIAAYKIADLVSRFAKDGHEVNVIMTENATQFITPLTMRTLSGNPVLLDMFEETGRWKVQHIGVAQEMELLVIAPATANIIAKLAHGLADDLLTTIVLATSAPILLVPSMNTNMYINPVVQENLAVLRKRGYTVLEPAEGELACGTSGKGRLPEIDAIYRKSMEMLSPAQDMAGQTVLITAGATREDLDPVRFITNRSTGRMGYALAEEVCRRGGRVLLVSGQTNLDVPAGVEFHPVRSAVDMFEASMRLYPEASIVIGAAAVADYRPADYSDAKIKKTDDDLVIRLARNPDILAQMGKDKGDRMLVGFAAETNDLIQNGSAKLAKKNLDLLVANDVTQKGAGFETETNIVTLLYKNGEKVKLPMMTKADVAKNIVDAIAQMLAK